MLLVSLDCQELSIDREAVDAEARELVLDAYRSAKISSSDPLSKFNAALKRYCKTVSAYLAAGCATRSRTYHRDGRPLTAT